MAYSDLSALSNDSTLSSGGSVSSTENNTHRTNYRSLINDLRTNAIAQEKNRASTSEPTDKFEGIIYCDTNSDPALLKYYKDGSENLETLVGLALTQTLTNKTLTSPTLTTVVKDATFATGGTETHKPMGMIETNTTAVGNVGAGEDDLMSYTIPANTLDTDGKAIRITAWGAGNGADNVTIKWHFGGTEEWTIVSAATRTSWEASVYITRTGASAQVMLGRASANGAVVNPVNATGIIDTTANIITKFTGENTADTTNDAVTQLGMIVEILN